MSPHKVIKQRSTRHRLLKDSQFILESLPNDGIGPSLPAWPLLNNKITFLKILGSRRDDNLPPHGRVFLVHIASKRYALKVFRFFNIEEIRGYDNDKRLEKLMPDKHVRHHMDPFFAECRAFGRLKDDGQDAKLAVRCHGYLLLDSRIEQHLNTQFGVLDWGRDEEHKGQPLRAILKDYLDFHDPYRPRTLSRMRAILIKLNTEHRILNMDIKKENYLGGRLFDFSISITAPHILFQPGVRERRDNQLDADFDLSCLDGIIEAQEEKRRQRIALLRKRSPKSYAT